MITEESVLETLRRVPDRIIMATMGRDLDLNQPSTCLCGWFIREKLAEMQNVGASEVRSDGGLRGTPRRAAQLFGGSVEEWGGVYWGVVGMHHEDDFWRDAKITAIVEAAFVRRVDEACTPKRRPRKAK